MKFGLSRGVLRDGARGVHYFRSDAVLESYPERLSERMRHWADVRPDQTWMARRATVLDECGGRLFGDWVRVSYAEAWSTARCLAQALLERGLSVDRPVLILSENSLEHALLALGCMVAGVPFVPVSAAYALPGSQFEKLRHVVDTVTPGLVFAADATRHGQAIQAVIDEGVEIVLGSGEVQGRRCTSFQEMTQASPTSAVDVAMAATGPDTIVKFLFTSGSTSRPKAVVNTQRMLCANQQQAAQALVFDEPPVLVDWLPWHHTFGGNNNVGMTLYHGGTLYIDDGKPTPALMSETLRNLREISPTVYFNVPTGFESIANAMRTDAQLRKTLLARVQMFFYAGAAMSQSIWDTLYECMELELGQRVAIGSGLGMTETAPHALFCTSPFARAGDLGLPGAGMEVKLVDVQGKVEIRYRGPNVTPGYWRAPQETARAFDEEGYFRSGDAVRWIDETDIHRGLAFDGRIAEDFKLATGTFVSVGPLRSRVIAAGAPFIQDVVLTGLNMNEIGALVFPTDRVYELGALPAGASLHEVLGSAPVLEFFQSVVDGLARTATGSANRIARMCLLADPPTMERGEATDKGSINQRAVLSHRAETVAKLHADELQFILKPRS